MYAKLQTALAVGLVAGLLQISGTAAAGEKPEVPASLPNVEVVDGAFVLNAMESGDYVLLDARKGSGFEAGSIPGAINCPTSKGDEDLGAEAVAATVTDMKGCEDLDKTDTSAKIATFCNGDHCWRSSKAALALKQMGYENVVWYRLGLNDWKAKGYPVE